MTVTGTLDAGARTDAAEVTVSVGSGTAVEGTDFATVADFTLTIPAGQRRGSQTFTLTLDDDTIDEPEETVTVSGTAPGTVLTVEPAILEIADDDDTPTVTLKLTPASIRESDDPHTPGEQQVSLVTATLTHESSAATTVEVSAAAVSPAVAGDYTLSTNKTLSFAAGAKASSGTVTIEANDNDVYEPGKSVTVSGFADNALGIGQPDQQTLAITEDETASVKVVLSVNPESVSEDAIGDARTVTVTGTLDAGARPAATEVTVLVRSGTAAEGTDFATVADFTLTIPAGQRRGSQTFTLAPDDDTIDEPAETVTVSGTAPATGLTVEPATLEIADDDDAPTVTLKLSDDGSIGEDDGQAKVTATLTHASSLATTVEVSAAAVSPAVSGDYRLSTNRTLSFTAGATMSSGTVTITALNNHVDAPDKTVTVSGDASNTLGVTDPVDVTLTITDDDTRGVTVSESRLAIAEGGMATYTVVLASQPTGTVTVRPSRKNGDEDVTVSEALTFTEMTWNAAQTVTVRAAPDSDAVDDTATIVHDVSGGDYGSVTADDVAVTVNDDEEPSSAVALSVTPDSVREEGGAQPVTVKAMLDGGTRGTATAVTVSVGGADDSAVKGTDYTTVDSFTITIPANQASETGTFTLTPDDDTIDEPAETVTVSGTASATGLTVEPATLEIADDDDAPTVTLKLSDDGSIGEDDGQAKVTATLTHASSLATTVEVSAAAVSPAVSGDYRLSTNRTLSFTAGATMSSGTVTITALNNHVDAPDKTVTVSGEASNPPDVTDPVDVTLTITDDDTRGVTVSESRLAIAEGGMATYTVVLASQPTGTVTVRPSRKNGDEDVTVSEALTFTEMTWNAAQTVTVRAAPDSDAVDDTATIVHDVSGGDYGSVTADDVAVTVTVNDDEEPSSAVALSVTPDSVREEGGAQPVTVKAMLDGGTRGTATAVTVSVGGADDSAVKGTDYTTVDSFTITIPANQASETGTFTLTPTNDTIDEPAETVTVSGTAPGTVLTVEPATLEIADNDGPPTVTLELSEDGSIGEDGGQARVTATLTHASSAATTVEVSAAAVSPAVSGDYRLSTNRTLSFTAGATMSSGTVTITALNNHVDAPDKTVTVSGEASNPPDVTDPVDVTLTITDDDTRGVTVSESRLAIAEGGMATYTVVLASQPTGTVTVRPSRKNGDEDVTVSEALTFTEMTWNAAQTVTVRAAPDSDAVDDTATIVHDVSGGDYGSVTADDVAVTVTVNDDEEPSSAVALSVTPDSVREEGGAQPVTVKAMLDGGTRGTATAVTVSVGGADDSAVKGTDYTTVDSFTITIPANQASETGTFTLTPTNDTIDEPAETVTVSGTAPGTVLTVEPATLEIADNDGPPTVTLELSEDGSIGEDGGKARVTATLTHASSAATTVEVSAAAVSPAVSGDYRLSTNRTLSFTAGATMSSGTVTITALNNHVDAPDKTVTVSGEASNPPDVTDPVDVTLTITDDDTRGVTVSESRLAIAEGGMATYTVVLASQPTGTVTVRPSRKNGDEDVTVSEALTFTEMTWNAAQTVTVRAAPDSDAVDDTATIVHDVSGGDYGSVTADDVAVTVTDTDTVTPALTVELGAPAHNDVDDSVTVTRSDVLTYTATVKNSGNVPLTGVQVKDLLIDTSGKQCGELAIGASCELSGGHTVTQADVDAGKVDNTATATATEVTDAVTASQRTLVAQERGLTLAKTATTSGFDGVGDTLSYSYAVTNSGTMTLAGTVTITDDKIASSDITCGEVPAGGLAPSGTVTCSASYTTVQADVDGSGVTNEASATLNGVTSNEDTAQVSWRAPQGQGPTLSLQGGASSDEDAGPLAFTVTLSQGSLQTVTAAWATADGTATAGEDYAAASGRLTLAPGATSGTIAVTITDDRVDEPDETVGMTLSDAVNATLAVLPTVTGTITDDDTRGVTVSESTLEIDEGGRGTYTVALRSQPTGAVTVRPSRKNGDMDVTVSEALTFTETTWATAQTVTVTADDDPDAEDDEATITHTVSGADYASETADDVVVTVTDNDTPSTAVTLSVNPSAVDEHAGATSVAVTGRLNGAPTTTAITVTVAVSADTASTSDFTAVADFALTIDIGDTEGTATFELTPTDDGVDEEAETLTVGGTNDDLAMKGATLTITDNDTRGIEVTPTALTVVEGGSETYTVVLTSQPTGTVTVEPSRKNGDEDVTVSEALTFTETNWATVQTVTVTADEDPDALNDTATIGHEVSGGDYGSVTADDVVVTVTDNDTPSTAVTLSVNPSAVDEDAAATSVAVTGRLNGAPTTTATSVTVSVSADTASTSDFTAVADFALTIDIGDTEGTATFELTPTDDGVDEEDETLTVDGETGSLSVTPASLTITNVAARGIEVHPTTLTVTEGADGETYTVVLKSQPTGQVTVTPSVNDNPDVGVSPEALTFTASTWNTAQTVTVSAAEDDDTEPDSATVEHTVSGADYEGLTAAAVAVSVLEIADDTDAPPPPPPPPPPPAVSIAASEEAVEEGRPALFTVTRSGDAAAPLTVTIGVTERGRFIADTPPTEVSFAANARTATLLIATEDDATDEPDGSVTATLAAGTGYVLGSSTSATVPVTDNDAPPRLTIGDVSAVEGTGMIAFTVRLTAASDFQVSVIRTSQDVTATADEDYEPELGTLVLEPGQTDGTISVPILDDTLDEMAETFKMVLSDPVNATLADDAATGTIFDDDESVAAAWLARFGRTAASQVADAIGARLAERAGSEQASQATVAGRRLEALGEATSTGAFDEPWQEPGSTGNRVMEFRELLAGSSFAVAVAGRDGSSSNPGHWTAWGRGAVTQFTGEEKNQSIRGQVSTGLIGADYDSGTFLGGLSAAYSDGRGEVDVRGTEDQPLRTEQLTSWLLSVHPYVQVEVTDRLAVWGLFGYGQGRMALADGDRELDAAIAMTMGAFGGRGVLLSPEESDRFTLAIKSDGLVLWIGSEASGRLPEATADVQRLRLLLEGSVDALRGPAGVLTPTLEVGARYDGGAAETGAGLEVGGGLRYAYPAWGLSIAANGRWLIVHEDRGYEQWGVGASVRVAPGSAGRGPSLALNTAWGETTNQVEQLWLQGAGLPGGVAADDAFVPAGRLEAELGYGVQTVGGALVTPFIGVSLADGGSPAYRLGGRVSSAPSFHLDLEANRRETGAAPEHSLRLSASISW